MKFGFIADNDLEGIEADCRFAAEHGFEGLEFNYWATFKDLTAETVGQTKKILDQYGIGCSTLGIWGWNHIAPDAEERAESHRQLERAIEFAQTLGAPILIAGGGEFSEDDEENVAEYVKVMPPFLDKVAAAGMKTAIYGFHGGFIKNIGAYEKMWDAGLDVGIKLDPANIAHAHQDYIAVLRHHGDKVLHVHIKEHVYHDGDVASQPAAGMGDIAWGKVMAFLYENDYQGYLTMEPHGPKWSRPPLREKMLLLSQRYIGQFIL